MDYEEVGQAAGVAWRDFAEELASKVLVVHLSSELEGGPSDPLPCCADGSLLAVAGDLVAETGRLI